MPFMWVGATPPSAPDRELSLYGTR